ncbi:MAG: ABC transporter ATP-binding protein [Bifidobacteriaceae bacterium]|jgi:ABC-2 type transport system ATP-binding protein|nr:ABC transporter ATP-binding protein [Bifidobacteriaceae bacterium]
MLSTDNAIMVTGLRKTFGTVKALDGLDLRIRHGEIAGFLGPNGAGKSTTLRVLLGLIRADPESPPIEVLGADPWRDAVELHKRLAYVPGDVNLWPSLTGGETIDYLGGLRGGLDQRRREELIERFELDPSRKNRVYSKGNRQKVALVAALAARAELFLFDEPTAGLDPIMEAVFTECVAEIKSAGGTVLLSSHILAEVEKTCDTVTIIRAGRAVEAGSLADMRHLTRFRVEVKLRGSAAALAGLEGVHDLTHDPDRARFTCDTGALDAVMTALAGIGIETLTCAPPSLEELFLSHYATPATPATPAAPDVPVAPAARVAPGDGS